jgi:asparagine synthase (glutamine-hydrolysing)
MARQHVTVALSGDGGDELFAGYERYAIHADRQIYETVPAWARRFYRENVFPRLPRTMKGRKFSYNVSLPSRERYVDGLAFIPQFERDFPLLSDDFREVLHRSEDPANALRREFAKAPARDGMSEILYVDTKTYLVGDILTKVDRMSMLNSLEVRVPLLDQEVVEFAAGLPMEWKMRGKQQKYILRRLAERVGVPKEVLYRPKQGFALPLVHWMRNELKEMLMLLLDSRTLQRGYFDPAGIRRIMNDHLHGGKEFSARLWRLLMFELWHRNFLEKFVKPAGLFSIPVVADSRRKAQNRSAVLASASAGE